jgi:hypothetical protein
LAGGVSAGMRMVAFEPSMTAAMATAWAWLPDE